MAPRLHGRQHPAAVTTTVVVSDLDSLPARIDVVDPWSGRRTPLKELAPPDRSGVVRINFMFWLAHGRGYAYSPQHEIDQLFVVTGWQAGAAARSSRR